MFNVIYHRGKKDIFYLAGQLPIIEESLFPNDAYHIQIEFLSHNKNGHHGRVLERLISLFKEDPSFDRISFKNYFTQVIHVYFTA